MSIDLDWAGLSTLTDRLVASLNRNLKKAERPSFLGPVTVTSFDFGTNPPDVELIDVRDIYRDFLEEDKTSSNGSESYDSELNEEEWEQQRSGDERSYTREYIAGGGSRQGGARDEEEFEWVSRRGVGRALAEYGPGYHPFPPHVRYGGVPSTSNILGPGTLLELNRRWKTITPVEDMIGQRYDSEASGRSAKQEKTTSKTRSGSPTEDFPSIDAAITSLEPAFQGKVKGDSQGNQAASVDTENDLQFHLRVRYSADIRVGITTSLVLNYPSSLFMALPIRLTIVGFEFDGEVVVAYQPSQKRVHICVLDDEDPYRPASASYPAGQTDDPLHPHASNPYDKERIPAGARLLPHIFIESEIGQADKQVLRNVSKVERFIQDMMRTTLEEELVFPNFHTIVYGDNET